MIAQYASCPTCRELTFPVHVLSPCGHPAEPMLHPFVEDGEVYAWTRSHGADGSQLIAMADFLDGKLRVTAPVRDVDSIVVGDRLVVIAEGDGFALSASS